MNRLILTAAILIPALAEAATVRTQLSTDRTSVGSPVQLELQVEGTTNVIAPRDLNADGFQLLGTNRSTQVQIVNGRMSTSAIIRYTIMPTEEGELEIPALELTIDGRKETTQPQKLQVMQGNAPSSPGSIPGQAAPGQPSASRPDAAISGKVAYAEVVVPKKSIYVGELVPIELRFYFRGDQLNRFHRTEVPPQFSGEGLTVSNLVDAGQSEQTVDGTQYLLLTYKAAITPVKSGELEVPAVTYPMLYQEETDAPAGMDDMFGQFFRGRFSQTRQIELKSDPFKVEVKSLPKEGRPKGYGGAIGEFSIAAKADPRKAAAGDPITLGVAISGRGNFDSMAEPELEGTDGWKVYPATDKFEPTDKVGYSGTKTFDFPIVAQTRQSKSPVAEFSYFDPIQEKYETLTTEAFPVDAEGTGGAAVAAASPQPSVPQATPAPEKKEEWIASMTPRSFEPMLSRPAFWIANGAAGVAFLAFIAVGAVRRARFGPAARRRELVRQRNQALRGLENCAGETFYEEAMRLMSIQAELDGARDAFSWAREDSRGEGGSRLREVLERADAMKFGGGIAISAENEERRRIAALLREACK